MQHKVDTKGYKINGLRAAVANIKECVRMHELYFVHYDKRDCTVYVNLPSWYAAGTVLIIESGVYKMTQQELADLIVDKLRQNVI